MATKKAETQKEELKRLKASYEKDLKTKKEASSKGLTSKGFTAARALDRRFSLKSDYGTGQKVKDIVKSQDAALNARLNQKEQRIEDLKKAIKAKK